jgi:hypothetical protein
MSFRKGQLVEWTGKHGRELGTYDHTARFGTGFVAAFVKTLAGGDRTVAVTKLRPAAESSPGEQRLAAGHAAHPSTEHAQPSTEPDSIPEGFHRNRWNEIVPIPDFTEGDAAVDRLPEELHAEDEEDVSELPSARALRDGTLDRLEAKYANRSEQPSLFDVKEER